MIYDIYWYDSLLITIRLWVMNHWIHQAYGFNGSTKFAIETE